MYYYLRWRARRGKLTTGGTATVCCPPNEGIPSVFLEDDLHLEKIEKIKKIISSPIIIGIIPCTQVGSRSR